MYDKEAHRDRPLQSRPPLTIEELNGYFDKNPTPVTVPQLADALLRQPDEISGFFKQNGVTVGQGGKLGRAEISKILTAK